MAGTQLNAHNVNPPVGFTQCYSTPPPPYIKNSAALDLRLSKSNVIEF